MALIFISLFAAGVVIFPIFIVHAQLTVGQRHQEKLYRKAVSKGHEATATLKRSYAPSMDNPKSYLDRQQMGIYTFKYKNRTYKIRMRFDVDPPYETQVYWVKNPKRAGTRGGINDVLYPWVIAYFVVFVIAYFIIA